VKFFSSALIFAFLLMGIACGGNDGGGSPVEQRSEIGEEYIVQDAYRTFDMEYYEQSFVHKPIENETLESYVNSYRRPVDIYTEYYDVTTANQVSRNLSTDEYLSVRTYEPGILYIAFEKFVDQTAQRIVDIIDAHIDQGYDSLILDLRVNTGGLVRESVALLDYFIAPSHPAAFGMLCELRGPNLFTVYNDGDFEAIYGHETAFDRTNMVVLTSGTTASAAEIVTAGLVFYEEATQVGATTFGKNRAQGIIIYNRGDGFAISRGIVYHAGHPAEDREGIGISPEPSYTTSDPFTIAGQLFSITGTDPLIEDWIITDTALANLYDRHYWRSLQYPEYAVLFRSFSQSQ
jgi:hypothetical protein